MIHNHGSQGYWFFSGLLALTLSTGCKTFINAHWGTAHYSAGSVGALVNNQFNSLVQRCHVVPDDERATPGDYNGHDFIPTNFPISDGERYTHPLREVMHPSYLFLYPFTETERSAHLAAVPQEVQPAAPSAQPSPAIPTLDNQHVMSEQNANLFRVGTDILPVREQGFPGRLYRQSCAAYVSAEANAGISFPIASVQSSLRHQFSAGGRINITSGFFRSPYTAMLRDGGPRGLYARLMLWAQYGETPALLQSPRVHALNSFGGLVVLSAETNTESTTVNLDASAAYSAGVVSAGGNLSARYENQSSYNNEDVQTLVTQITESSFTPLPTPSEIAAVFRGTYERATVEPTTQMASGQTNEHRISIPGVPKSICEGGTWSFVAAPAVSRGTQSMPLYAERTATITTTATQESGLPACRFTVRGMPNPDLFPMPNMPAVTYTLTSSNGLHAANGTVALALDVSGIQFRVNPNPQVTLSNPAFRPEAATSGETSVRHRWVLPVNLYDSGNPVVHAQDRPLVPLIAQIQCRSGAVAVSATMTRDEASGQYSIAIAEQNAVTAPPPGYGYEPCQTSLRVQLPLENGGTAERAVQTILDRPIAAALPPVPVPPVQATRDFLDSVHAQDRLINAMQAR